MRAEIAERKDRVHAEPRRISPKPVRAELVEAPFFLIATSMRRAALRQAQVPRNVQYFPRLRGNQNLCDICVSGANPIPSPAFPSFPASSPPSNGTAPSWEQVGPDVL